MALTKIPASLLDTSSGFDLQGNITLGDSEKIRLGDGPDLDIYHDGSNSFIEDLGDGVLFVKASGGIYFNGKTTDEPLARFIENGAVNLYYDNDLRIATSSAGATVDGTLTVTGNLDITGDINSYNVTDLDVTDQTITLGAGQTEANSGGSGIIIDGSNASILWNETSNRFDLSNDLKVGAEDGGQFSLEVSGGATGTAEGGELRLNTAADYDGTYNHYRLDVFEDDFRIGRAGTTDITLDSSGNVGIGTSSPVAKLDIHMSDSNGDYGRGRDGNLNLENTNTSVTEGGWLSISGYMGNTANSGQYPMGYISGGKQTTAADGDYGGYLTFWTTSAGANGEANSGGYERMRIDSSGNVGIGTTAPFSKLSINSQGAPATSAGNMATTGLTVHNGTGGTGVQLGTYDAGSWGYIQSGYVNNATVAREFRIMNGANYTMTLSNTGNVGIGTTSPLDHLHINDDSGDARILLDGHTNFDAELKFAEAGVVKYTVGHEAGTDSFVIGTTNVDTQKRLVINSTGKVGIGTDSPTAILDVSAAIGSDIAQTSTHTYSSNRNWAFRTNNYGSSNWGGWSLERSAAAGGAPNKAYIGIHANGNVGIGYGGSAGSGGWDGYNENPTARLHVGGDIKSTLQVKQGNSDGTPRYINIPYASAGSGFAFNFEDLATHPGVNDQASETNSFMFEVNVTSYLHKYVKALIMIDTNSTNSLSVVTLHNSGLTCSATIPTGSEVITVTIGGLWGNATNYMGRITTF